MTDRIYKYKTEAIRSRVLNSNSAQILGPGSEHFVTDYSVENFSEPPRHRYITGILYPKVDRQDTDGVSGDDTDVDFDAESEQFVVDNTLQPSSIGLSFYCLKTSTLDYSINTSVYDNTVHPWIDLHTDLLESILNIVTDETDTEHILKISDDTKTIAYADRVETKPISHSKQLRNLLELLKEKPEMKDATAFLYRL